MPIFLVKMADNMAAWFTHPVNASLDHLSFASEKEGRL